jgi:hypothetical protein
MASNATPAPPPAYGVITLDGQRYIERPQLFVAEVQVNSQKQVFTNLRLTLPGVADFLLKGLSKETKQLTNPDVTGYLFRFRIVNAEGSTWFFSGGLGILDDRVISTLCFGSGQFPWPLIPPINIHANGSLIYEIEDTGLKDPSTYPYIIYLGFHGAYLIPATGSGSGTGPLAFSGTGATVAGRS